MNIDKQTEFAAAEWRNIQFELDEISEHFVILLQYDKSIPAVRIAEMIRDIQYRCEKRADLLYKLLDILDQRRDNK